MQICSAVKVAKPLLNDGHLAIRWYNITALWDTGAVTSAISRRMALKMNLQPKERTVLATTTGAVNVIKDIVLLDLQIDDTVLPVMVAVVDTIPGEGNDFLIGLDVIQCGEFTVGTNHTEGVFAVNYKPYPGLFRTVDEIFNKNS